MSQSQNKTNQSSSAQHDERGRFIKGNSGGPGNPHARQVAQLRKVMLECVTEKDMQEITLTLIDLAKQGDVQACRLLFSYLLGKPTPGVDPDQLDVEEWELSRKTAKMFSQAAEVIESPEASHTLKITRAAREMATEKSIRLMMGALDELNEQDRRKEQQRQRRRHKAQSKAKASSGSPSTNGKSTDEALHPVPDSDSESDTFDEKKAP